MSLYQYQCFIYNAQTDIHILLASYIFVFNILSMKFEVWGTLDYIKDISVKQKKKYQLNIIHKRHSINFGIMTLIQSHAKAFLCSCV